MGRTNLYLTAVRGLRRQARNLVQHRHQYGPKGLTPHDRKMLDRVDRSGNLCWGCWWKEMTNKEIQREQPDSPPVYCWDCPTERVAAMTLSEGDCIRGSMRRYDNDYLRLVIDACTEIISEAQEGGRDGRE